MYVLQVYGADTLASFSVAIVVFCVSSYTDSYALSDVWEKLCQCSATESLGSLTSTTG